MSFIYRFESGGIPTSTIQEGSFIKVEIVYQLSTPARWAAGLDEPDFTATAIELEYPFQGVKLNRSAPVDSGLVELQQVDFTTDNIYLLPPIAVASGAIAEGYIYQNNGYTTVTYNGTAYANGDIFIGVGGITTYTTSGTGTVNRAMNMHNILSVHDPKEYTLHFRVYHKKTSAGAYVCRGQFIYDTTTLNVNRAEMAAPERWKVEWSCIDSVLQYEQRNIQDSITDALQFGTDLTEYTIPAGGLYCTFIGTTSRVQHPGAYQINRYFHMTFKDLGQWTALVGEPIGLRFVYLIDILDAIKAYLGITTDLNDGGSWAINNQMIFEYNDSVFTGAPGGTNLQATLSNELLVISRLNYNIGGSMTYAYNGTFFDPTGESVASFYRHDSFLDVLDDICLSLGLQYSINVNSSGARYMHFKGVNHYESDEALSNIVSPESSEPNATAMTGIEVTVPAGTDTVKGANGSGSRKTTTIFSLANNVRDNDRFIDNSATHGAQNDFLTSLFYGTNLVGTQFTEVWSICSITVRQDSNVPATDPGNVPEYGEYIDAVFGVRYPNSAAPYNTWVQVPAMALGHILFNDVQRSVDPVGLYRSFGALRNVKDENISTSVKMPPYKITYSQGNLAKTVLAIELAEDLVLSETEYTGYEYE